MLALLFIDGLIVGILSVAFLNLYLGTVVAPIGILIAAVGNALLLWLASAHARAPLSWLPVFGWGLVLVIALGGGPGGDVLFLSDWRVVALILAGVAVPAALASFLQTRRRVEEAARRDIDRAARGR
ncbi:facilitated glucose transporter [Gordonia crocea]|uniref:Uncharacterized protein n=1 Tax=Gordonia crocea TaxID=589162 RepID=A0A7I9UYQ1_9ACTN|nr:facilitated glucose transporter [Gordonia crocea]GED98298.1 hypothetical protein nbrc107697_23370 [Gordonia crocea]GED98784.1 hypothetical protein nbrc107697_28230 [Gordonia crocea]